MSQFLVDRYEAVERLDSIKSTKNSYSLSNTSRSNIYTYTSQENLNPSCKLCNEDHYLRTCPKFKLFTVQQRVDFVYKNKVCNNCLSPSHTKTNCKSKHTCLHCKKTHHTLLHFKKEMKSPSDSQASNEANSSSVKFIPNNVNPQNINPQEMPTTSSHIQANFSASYENILLRTALVQIEHLGEHFTIRALIDPGSQRTFLSERIRNRLQLPFKRSHFDIIDIGGQKHSANKECEFVLFAKRHNIRFSIKAIVLQKLTTSQSHPN